MQWIAQSRKEPVSPTILSLIYLRGFMHERIDTTCLDNLPSLPKFVLAHRISGETGVPHSGAYGA